MVKVVPFSLLSLLLVSCLIFWAGWLGTKNQTRANETQVQEVSPLQTEAANRYRQGQPNHWRSLFMHR